MFLARAHALSGWEFTHGMYVDAWDALAPATELDSPTLCLLRSGREIAPDSPDSSLRNVHAIVSDVLQMMCGFL